MVKIIFNGFNSNENPFSLNTTASRVINSQNVQCTVDNEQGSIEFAVSESKFVTPDCQVKSVKTIMDDFVNYNCNDDQLNAYNKVTVNMVNDVVKSEETGNTVMYQAV